MEAVPYMEDQYDMREHMPFLASLAERAAVVVEIGCGHGNGSTRAFARGLIHSPRTPKVFLSVDIDPERPQRRPIIGYWQKITAPSELVSTADAAACVLNRQAIDILFIDTEHTYEQLKAEIKVWSPLASKQTIWVFHDTWMFRTDDFEGYNPMTDAVKEFCAENPDWEFVDYSKRSFGLGLMRHKDGPWGDIQCV